MVERLTGLAKAYTITTSLTTGHRTYQVMENVMDSETDTELSKAMDKNVSSQRITDTCKISQHDH